MRRLLQGGKFTSTQDLRQRIFNFIDVNVSKLKFNYSYSRLIYLGIETSTQYESGSNLVHVH
jgi:hypothetical protein